ncbi:hypothetical protein C8R43DRAFT_1130478 [Mycena crocata]|nr:hypothetical protein C8R43DRAFT_1130478 [Mycena crocata]
MRPGKTNALSFVCAYLGIASVCAEGMDLNQTLFTPESVIQLPEGTYIATGTPAVAQLADYLDAHPEQRVTRLLISDSSIHDAETGHGYLSFGNDDDVEEDELGYYHRRSKRPVLTDEEEDRRLVMSGAILRA